jgi:hypothetical protein
MKKDLKKENTFTSSLERFAESIEGLREFVQLVEAFLNERKSKVIQAHRLELAPMLLAFKYLAPEKYPAGGPTEEQLRNSIDGKVTFETAQESPDGKSINMKITGKAKKVYDETIDELFKTERPIHLLYRSTLMNLVSAVELFLSELIHLYYVKFPDALGAKDKVFSLEDLKTFDSVEDARLYIIESRIEGIMHGSFSDWVDFFRNQPKLSLGYLKDTMPKLVETCQRRNLIVHNGGIVNSIYLSKVDKTLSHGLKNGDSLNISSDYLTEKLELFELSGCLVAFELWKKFDAADKTRAKLLLERIFYHVLAKRWDISEGLSLFLINDKGMSEEEIFVGKLNYWLSLKRKGKWKEIQSEVEAEDMSAARIRYRLGWFSLCERKDDFFRELPSALRAGELHISELEEFPIFDELRSDSRFARASKKPKRLRKVLPKNESHS